MSARNLLALLLGLLLSACTAPMSTVSVDPSTLAAAKPGRIHVHSDHAGRYRSRHLLALSSGGADGAFGAGVLVGWSEAGHRPVFDVVSGVSTGALQAPLAFLGQRYDAVLENVFTTTSTEDVFDSNGIGVLVKPGLYDSGPLERLLDRLITDSMLGEIAAEHRKGRRLYVTTTDLSLGRSVIWDLGALAASNRPDARLAFIRILVASSAPPGFAEPVPLPDPTLGDIRLHGDGGVKQPIVVEPWMMRGPGRRTLHVIANGHVSTVAANRLEGYRVVSIARRAVAQLLRSLTYGAVERVEWQAKSMGVSFRLQRIPNEVAEARDPLIFAPEEMRLLFERGRASGRDPSSWLVATPKLGN